MHRTRSKTLIFALVHIVALLTTSLVETAAGAQSTQDARRARVLFDRGIAHADAGRIEEALHAFEGSAQRVRRASTSYNLGLMLFRLGRYEAALQALDEAMGLEPTPTDQANVASLRAEIESILSPRREPPSPVPVEEETPEQILPEAPSIPEPPAQPPRPESPQAVPVPPEASHAAMTGPAIALSSASSLAIAGVTVAGLGLHDRNVVRDAPYMSPWESVRDEHERAPRRAAIGVSLFSVGVGAGVASLVWARSRRARGQATDEHVPVVVVSADRSSILAGCAGTF